MHPKVCILSGVHDDLYRAMRNDHPVLCTSAGKRKLLYEAIARASDSVPLILSPHPRGRGKPTPLPESTSKFAGCPQIFSRACGVRKLRYFIDLIHYARHVSRYVKSDDIIIIDNYELIYIVAIYFIRMRGRRNRVILEYEDGKHAIDRGWVKCVTWLAEWMGRPLVKAAMLATPTLAKRLPSDIPLVLIPGILEEEIRLNPLPSHGEFLHVLYSGSLDVERGIPLLLEYLETCKLPERVVFEITGQGKFGNQFNQLMARYPDKIRYHGSVSSELLAQIRSRCHFGLNLQSSSNPISEVTYPSKTFDYFNAGLRLISTRAAGVGIVLGNAAYYLNEETPAALATAIEQAVTLHSVLDSESLGDLQAEYSLSGTVHRLSVMLGQMSIR